METVTIPETSMVIHAQAAAPLKVSYQYKSLPPYGWIRVLVLHPGSFDDVLFCSLSARKIDEAGVAQYEALSYVWGRNERLADASHIECNDQIIGIGENLACALRHIRRKDETKYLWVDAICIDQGNLEERAEQVQQMGEIYASAASVLIWLGPDHLKEASDCFDLIHNTTTTLSDMISRHGSVSGFPPISPESPSLCSDAEKWKMVQRMMDLEWFNRVWVLQEVGLARSAVLLYGSSTIDWAYLVELMLIIASRVDVSSFVGNIKSGMIWDFYEDLWRSYGNLDSWRNHLPMTRSLDDNDAVGSFINILNDGRSYKATDQRDRVYAFLSHPSAACDGFEADRLVVPNYRLSVDHVYLETARSLLATDPHPWTVLTCVDHLENSPSLSQQRPSWVPRWDEGWRVYWLGYPEMWYRAGGAEAEAFQFEISRQSSSLILPGVLVDSIVWVSRAFDSDELRIERQKDTAPIQQLWQELQNCGIGNTIYGPSVDDQEYAFSLVIAAGRAADDGPAHDDPNHHRAVYQAYKATITSSESDSQSSPTLDKRDADVGSKEEDLKAIELDVLTYIGSNQRRALHNRRVFQTAKGYYGVAHREAEKGDLCYVSRGANMPFVLRREADNGEQDASSTKLPDRCRLVGEAYIQGVMRGEVFEGKDASQGDMEERMILIV